MRGTRLCQLLAQWAEEDRTMSELYESISLDDAKQVIAEAFGRHKALKSVDETENEDTAR